MASKIATLAAIMATVVALTPVTTAMSTEQHLRRLSSNEIVHQGNGAFVDGTETVYDDLSLAWRFLGFYTDCNVCVDGDGDDDDNDEDFQDPVYCIENGEDNTVCRRYALWAAYVDEGYEGNGQNEYIFYDRHRKRWNDSQCNGGDDSRCVKMDCHDPSSKNFKLIGVYKDHKIGNFLENMIDYSGDCVWNDNEYKFMQAMNNDDNNNNNVAYWPPKKCTAFKNGHGYYDVIPTSGGTLELAVYNDASCTIPYELDSNSGFSPEQKIGRGAGDIESWNSAMDAFKICQPCLSYDTLFLNNINKKHGYNANGDRYGYQGDDDAADGDEAFVCRYNLQQDEPTNQCKVFMEDGDLSVATYRDILLAESQGGVTGIDLSPSNGRRGNHMVGDPFVKPSHKLISFLLFLLSIAFFVTSLSKLFEKDRSKNSSKRTMKEPLVGTRNKSSSKSVITAAAVTTSSRKSKDQRASEKEQKKAQRKEQKPKKKSILRKSSKYDDDDGASHDSTHYSKFQL